MRPRKLAVLSLEGGTLCDELNVNDKFRRRCDQNVSQGFNI